MNTHDKYELPPLPERSRIYECEDSAYLDEDLRAYARAAIEADRKRRGEPAVQSDAEVVETCRAMGLTLSLNFSERQPHNPPSHASTPPRKSALAGLE